MVKVGTHTTTTSIINALDFSFALGFICGGTCILIYVSYISFYSRRICYIYCMILIPNAIIV